MQLPAYNADLEKFAGFDATVVAVTTDNTHSNKAWVEKMGGLNYPVLSDFWPHGNVAIKYGVLREEGITERAIFLLDKEGKIRYIDIHPIGDQPDNEDLFEVLRKM